MDPESPTSRNRHGDAALAPRPIAVTLITSDGCHYCSHAREVLAAVGADCPLEIAEMALDSDEGAAAQRRWRAPFPPLLLVEGRLFGFGRISERKLRRFLDELGA